jgi:hypothetical protein
LGKIAKFAPCGCHKTVAYKRCSKIITYPKPSHTVSRTLLYRLSRKNYGGHIGGLKIENNTNNMTKSYFSRNQQKPGEISVATDHQTSLKLLNKLNHIRKIYLKLLHLMQSWNAI